MSIATEIADALADGLSAATFSGPYYSITATRGYVPDYNGPALKALKVSVVPGPVEVEKSARGQDLFMHSIMVCIGKNTDGSNEQIDCLMTLCEEIVDAIRSGTLETNGMPENAQYFASNFQTTFDRDALNDRSIFLAQIEVTYRVPRDHVTVA
jgi:hypothetical protein